MKNVFSTVAFFQIVLSLGLILYGMSDGRLGILMTGLAFLALSILTLVIVEESNI